MGPRIAAFLVTLTVPSLLVRPALGEEAAPESKPMAPEGTSVTFTSKDVATEIFLARGDVPAGARPDPFQRLGVVPVTVNLAPGVYTVETSSPTSSTGHERLFVEQGAPLHVEVRSGDATVKTMGTILIGLGVVAVALGVVAIVSISPNDQHYDRFGIGLPLMLGGAAGAGLGFAFTALGATNIQAPHVPPNRSHPGMGPGVGGALVLRF
jgi:hypothetical protein